VDAEYERNVFHWTCEELYGRLANMDVNRASRVKALKEEVEGLKWVNMDKKKEITKS